ncbi:MAG: hypothetical protein IT282_08205 [Bacteroidetes bacterium]|nr:hypothetical protein [Bacteroidota bacterium]
MWISKALLLLLLAGAGLWELASAQETLYMSVLSSRRHAWGRNDNPVIGLFVSTDSGKNWQHTGWREYIRMFYTEAGPDDVLWSACGNGVLRSTDHGTSWRVTTGWEVTEVLKLSVDPRNPKRVAAATAYGPILTTDGGGTWNFLLEDLPERYSTDVCVDRTDGTLLLATGTGVYRRAPGDTGWMPTTLLGKDIRVLTQHPAVPNTFWAGTEDDGVWKSTDRGKTWSMSNSGLQHRTVYVIAIDPERPDTLYVGTFAGGVYRSTDGGVTWQQKAAGLSVQDIHALCVLTSAPGTVFAGTLNGGLYKSTDAGETWVFNSQEDAQVWGMSIQRRPRK